MSKSKAFSLAYEHGKEYQDFIDSISDDLKRIGVEMKLVSSNGFHHLLVEYDPEGHEVGRPKAFVEKVVTVNEIREMMKTKSAAEVAAELKISRSTLFRRLKELDGHENL